MELAGLQQEPGQIGASQTASSWDYRDLVFRSHPRDSPKCLHLSPSSQVPGAEDSESSTHRGQAGGGRLKRDLDSCPSKRTLLGF